MPARNDALQRLSEQLADGQAVDWSAVECDLDPALLAGLKQIEALAGGFGSVATQPIPPKVLPSLAAGTVFGHLLIQELIGRGAYGAVYKAHDSQLDRSVALKVLGHPTLSRAELLREGQLMARVDHPSVLKVYGAIEHDGQIGFACELMRGETLESWLARQGRLSATELISIGSELCAALCALHRGQVLHGDLKPGNVLRHPDGRWVVADFGSSQFAHDAYGSSGTPLYMAPEQFRQYPASTATDQYSLGVLLFRLATRRYPFEAETTAEIEAKHAADTRLRLLDLRPDLPRGLISAIERCLAIDPHRRFASIGALATALAEATPPLNAARKTRRLWALAIAASAVLAATGAVLWRAPVAPASTAVWLRTGSTGDQVLHPGEAVRPGEALALELTLSRSAHVYVVNEDSHGERFQLFPLTNSDLVNPLPAGLVRLPGATAGQAVDWRITSHGGRERFYVLIADDALSDLTQLALAQPQADNSGSLLADNSDPVRGVGGLAPRATSAPKDAGWIDVLRLRHPSLRIERFELANP